MTLTLGPTTTRCTLSDSRLADIRGAAAASNDRHAWMHIGRSGSPDPAVTRRLYSVDLDSGAIRGNVVLTANNEDWTDATGFELFGVRFVAIGSLGPNATPWRRVVVVPESALVLGATATAHEEIVEHGDAGPLPDCRSLMWDHQAKAFFALTRAGGVRLYHLAPDIGRLLAVTVAWRTTATDSRAAAISPSGDALATIQPGRLRVYERDGRGAWLDAIDQGVPMGASPDVLWWSRDGSSLLWSSNDATPKAVFAATVTRS